MSKHTPTNDWRKSIKKAVDHYGSQQLMADAIGCSQASVSMWLSSTRKPSAYHAKKIQTVTNGLVKARDILPEIFD